MKIYVLIKQVPGTDTLKIDEEKGTVIREGTDSIINPLDLYALEASFQLKEARQATITVISMGPESTVRSLREAIAMGGDIPVLVTGKEFAGSDTYATSTALGKVIRKLGMPDIILCGERATDGDTGQVGPGVAAALDLPVLTFISKIWFETDLLCVERLVENGIETHTVGMPAVLTLGKAIGVPRLPTLSGKKKSKTVEITRIQGSDLDIDPQYMGLQGSPTTVIKIFKPQVRREPKIFKPKNDDELEKSVDYLITYLKKEGFRG